MSKRQTLSTTAIDDGIRIGPRESVPGLLVAYTPTDVTTVDRCRVSSPTFSVGRHRNNDLVLHDSRVSGTHFRIFNSPRGWMIEDVDSTNGTYINGRPSEKPEALYSGTIIRAGKSVLVFEPHAASMLVPPPVNRYGMAGSFYVTSIIESLSEAACDGRHILITGETGVGKELAAQGIAAMIQASMGSGSILEHNCAQFASEDEANTTLFGVGSRVFSEVDCRAGLIEQTGDGVLFLDEANALPTRIQKSLLRLIENNLYHRIGESKQRATKARIIFASNDMEHSTAGLIHDLYPRLRVVCVPSLKERVADIPTIFLELLQRSLKEASISPDHYRDHLTGEHFEMLCQSGLDIAGFKALKDNVRGLKDVAKRLATKAVVGKDPAEAVNDVFYERFSSKRRDHDHTSTPNEKNYVVEENKRGPIISSERLSIYEQNKGLIIATYHDRERRISPTVRALKNVGFSCTRQHLSRYLKKWGVREQK